jgi:hypothetical protein
MGRMNGPSPRRRRRIQPLPDGEGVFNLCPWFSVAGEEAREEGVGLRREGIDGENPAEGLGQQRSPVTDRWATDCTRHLRRDVAGQAVDALQDELVTWSVQEQWMAPGFVVEHSQAHGALLQEGRRGAALPEGCKGIWEFAPEDISGYDRI